jgi:alpha-glucuronidase
MLSTTQHRLLLAAMLVFIGAGAARAEDGYDLWLRYRPVEADRLQAYRALATGIVADCSTATRRVACDELERGLAGLLGRPLSIRRVPLEHTRDGDILLETRRSRTIGDEGYQITTERLSGHRVTRIAANREIGLVYGVFAYLRLVQRRRDTAHLDIRERPAIGLRMLDHWDNLDGTIERGYAGHSLWNWAELPAIDPRLLDYARANASIGINGAVLNNVNADARILTSEYLGKVKAIADAWRPYGIRVYLSARFSAPKDIGGLPTADPLDPRVRRWWRSKADQIYSLVPDFGGFLVKANAEGQPGPQTYGRSHADGANMLAEALAPHHGIILWRAFVYSGAANEDRAKQAYDEFKPLDGKFRRNVIVQVKNGPVDFQPREPFHPLFGTMGRTRVAMEVQITKEYLGENTHLAYLGTMWSEVLRSRTERPLSSSRVMDQLSAIAGVANIGSDRNWTGSDFDQANWYAFGRLAWNPSLDPARIAAEWTRMTWGNEERLVGPVVSMMMRSREAVVDYMTPLGLAHQMASDHHYGPGPWVSDQPAPLWNPTYYNRADRGGIGFDRTRRGSNAVAQYAPGVGKCLASLKCVPDDELLWFHHLPWTYRMRSGASLWNELVGRYDRGLATVAGMKAEWYALAPFADTGRQIAVAAKLDRQYLEAKWWRDASIAFFESVSHLPLPKGTRAPRHALSWYKAIHFDTVPGYLTPGTGRQLSCVPPEGGPPCAL